MRPAIMIKGLEDLTKEAINKVAKEAEQLFAEMSQERMNNDGWTDCCARTASSRRFRW